jgi:hypothetical protein
MRGMVVMESMKGKEGYGEGARRASKTPCVRFRSLRINPCGGFFDAGHRMRRSHHDSQTHSLCGPIRRISLNDHVLGRSISLDQFYIPTSIPGNGLVEDTQVVTQTFKVGRTGELALILMQLGCCQFGPTLIQSAR